MKLYFLRHAEAVAMAAMDRERTLTLKGRGQAAVVGEFMKEAGLKPGRIISSPYLRAVETAEVVGAGLGVEVVQEAVLGCGMGLDDLREGLRGHASTGDLLLVGHEPDFSHCISGLLGSPSACVNVRKASLTCLTLDTISSRQGILEFSIPVKLLKVSAP